ncbi:MAG: hypothetical protein WC696_10815 [Candidatus Methylopumilus sp.]
MNHQVARQVGRAYAFILMRNQRAIWHREMVVIDVLFTLKDNFWHVIILLLACIES